MPVAELLERTSSLELGEWMAFERAYGPLGNRYIEQSLAEVVDAVKELGVVFQVVMGADPDDVEQPLPMPRPEDVNRPEEDEDDDDTVEC